MLDDLREEKQREAERRAEEEKEREKVAVKEKYQGMKDKLVAKYKM